MDTDRLLDELVLQTTAFADAIRVGDRSATVPTCPDWSLSHLAHHLGQAHRWTATVLGEPPAPEHPPLPEVTVPDGDDDASTWLLAGASAIAEALRTAGPDTPVTGFAEPVPARFWGRRMAHETLVHRFDAELTAGVAPWAGVAPELAADAIDEGLTLLETFGMAYRPGLAGRGEALHVHLTDVDGSIGEWVITRAPDGPHVERTHRKADVALRGPATAVLATLTNRREPDDAGIEVLGDAELFLDWRRHAAF